MSSTLYRTYSNPNIKAQSPSEWEYQQYKYGYETEDDEFYVIGDRVYVDGYKAASVAYFGDVEFSSGDWVGVVLDNPLGNHNGKVHGREYFQCAPMHGLFVRPHRVSRIPDSALGSSAASSRVSTPLHRLASRSTSKSPGSSTLDSYFYDEDYKMPTVASLERKLRSIEMRPPSRLAESNTRSSTTGILKQSGSRSGESPISLRTEELSRRIQASRSSSPTTVFNFRPKRAPLEQFDQPRGQATAVFDLSRQPPRLGDRVSVQSERGLMVGTLRFMGETDFATGEWAGIELDHPDGKNDGSVLDQRYFYCAKNHGLFVPATRVKRLDQNELDKSVFNRMRSTIKSPPPLKGSNSRMYESRSATPLSCESGNLSRASDKIIYEDSSTESPSYKDSVYDHVNVFDDSFGKSSKSWERPKFDDRDIELQLRRSLNRPPSRQTSINLSSQPRQPIPKAVKCTFSSSKYDGNPIARRTLQFD